MQLINALISRGDELDFRIHIRSELLRLGLREQLTVCCFQTYFCVTLDLQKSSLNVQVLMFSSSSDASVWSTFWHPF